MPSPHTSSYPLPTLLQLGKTFSLKLPLRQGMRCSNQEAHKSLIFRLNLHIRKGLLAAAEEETAGKAGGGGTGRSRAGPGLSGSGGSRGQAGQPSGFSGDKPSSGVEGRTGLASELDKLSIQHPAPQGKGAASAPAAALVPG